MSRKSPFERHRFPAVIILCAVRMYLRYPLSYQDVVDLLAERRLEVDRSSVFRWALKFRPELAKRTEKHIRRCSLNWYVDETYIRVGGKWRYLWWAVDANGQMIDFHLTARRDAKAIREINHSFDPHFDSITHIDQKWQNNRIESDRAVLKRLFYRQSFRSQRTAKPTLHGFEATRTIKRGHIYNKQPGVKGEITFVRKLFGVAA